MNLEKFSPRQWFKRWRTGKKGNIPVTVSDTRSPHHTAADPWGKRLHY